MIRSWIRRSNSHPFKLRGVKLLSDVQEGIDTIANMREARDCPVLKKLENLLNESISEYTSLSTDLNKAQDWIFTINDILLGKVKKKGRRGKRDRNTEKYKQSVSSSQVEEKLQSFILNLDKNKEKHSKFLQEVTNHFRKTYNNWKKYLFTCYDQRQLPNTNLELELSHSKLKKAHRRITGKKNSHHFLSLHGVVFSYCFNLEDSKEELIKILQRTPRKKFEERKRKEREKSRQRGEEMKTQRDVHYTLKKVHNDWIRNG